jgi:PAS domain S-box-containing protein
MLSIENLRTVFGSTPNGCLILYPDAPRFTIAYANQIYLDAVQRSADIIGKGVLEAFPENGVPTASAEYLKSALQEVMEQRTVHKTPVFRYDITNRENETAEAHFWICDTYPLLNDLNSIEFIVRIPTDVTQLISEHVQNAKSGEIKIQDANNPLFADSPDAVFTMDLEGRFLTVNKKLVEIAEFPEADLLKASYDSFIHPLDQQLVTAHFDRARNGEIGNFEAAALSASGKDFLLKITYLPIFLSNIVVGVYIIAKDITAVKQAEIRLEAYNQRIFNILESITDGFVAVDRNFTVNYWNKEAERILLKSREDAIGKNLWELYPQTVTLKFYSEYHRALEENVSIQFLEYFKEVNSWLEVAVYPSEDGLSIYFKDITDRIKGEDQLIQAKEQYQDLFDLSPMPTWVYDRETLAFLDVNKAAIAHYGYSREEFLSKTLKDIRPAEDVENLLQFIKNKDIPNRNSKDIARHVKKTGEVISVEVEGATISFHGRTARLVLVMDITERIEQELQITESIERYNMVSKATSDAIYEWSLLKRTLTWNRGFETLFGHEYSSTEDDDRWFSRLHPEDKPGIMKAMNEAFAARQRKITQEYRFRCADGSYKFVLDRSYLIYGDSDKPIRIIGAIQDITDRLNHIRKLEETNKKLTDISWLQCHVVRAPLARVMSLTDLLNYDETDQDKKELLHRLKNSADELDAVVREIIERTEGI